jgi:hypothetical protein
MSSSQLIYTKLKTQRKCYNAFAHSAEPRISLTLQPSQLRLVQTQEAVFLALNQQDLQDLVVIAMETEDEGSRMLATLRPLTIHLQDL